ncbi:hypothetical protein [Croceimicrobium sp.]|uniref:hypothetical protein n=1 Tax=Croceimicrobium sp. TaxID=2828340 RepID=UPI003BAD2F76
MIIEKKIIDGEVVLEAKDEVNAMAEAIAAKVAAQTAKLEAETAKNIAVDAQEDSEAAQVLSEDARDQALIYKNESETAKTGSETAQGLAEEARDQALIYKNESETAKTGSETAQGLTEEARDQALIYKNESETAKTGSETAQGLAEEARDQALIYKNESETAKTGSETAQGLTEDARDQALIYKNDAEGARDQALIYKGEAETSATNAATSEANAATSEANAADTFINGFQDVHKMRNSPYRGPLGLLTLWDNFQREPTTNIDVVSGVTLTPNNVPYYLIDGATATIQPSANRNWLTTSGGHGVGFSAADILQTSSPALRQSFYCEFVTSPNSSSNRYGITLYKDTNNWYRVAFSSSTIYVDQSVAGVVTNLLEASLGATFLRALFRIQVTYSAQSNAVGVAFLNLLTNFIPPNPTAFLPGEITYICFEGVLQSINLSKYPLQ